MIWETITGRSSVSVSQLNTCNQSNQSNQLLAEPDAFYFVNRAHAGMEDECDLESWIYRPGISLGSLCWLEDAEEIGTDDW
jgi:hypothetical protein